MTRKLRGLDDNAGDVEGGVIGSGRWHRLMQWLKRWRWW